MRRGRFVGTIVRTIRVCAVIATMLSLGGCNGNVGVGVSVGVPVGKHGYMSVGTGRWL
jgi:hypothetical protein